MDIPAEFQGYIFIATLVAGVVLGVLSYFKPKRVGTESTIAGAVLMDSRIGKGVLEKLDALAAAEVRSAVAIEGLCRYLMEREREAEKSELQHLRTELSGLRKARDIRDT